MSHYIDSSTIGAHGGRLTLLAISGTGTVDSSSWIYCSTTIPVPVVPTILRGDPHAKFRPPIEKIMFSKISFATGTFLPSKIKFITNTLIRTISRLFMKFYSIKSTVTRTPKMLISKKIYFNPSFQGGYGCGLVKAGTIQTRSLKEHFIATGDPSESCQKRSYLNNSSCGWQLPVILRDF